MSGYVVIVLRDDAGGYGAWSPDLLGCVAASRDYDEECVRLMGEAIAIHLDGMREDGDPIPEPTAVGALLMPAA
ncbi:type II toxin-antitoxin system HicB family antitoxin [Fodinicola feengrottensis]|uniref:type II toxin-antitoxin system HicB family antitoxin n=1 Tax=Fodinicola feengrottensis TaxID=435914 RepID=UPI0013D778E6|nr:type II toxin-antitoxin system HicB family antitoxin [Fodinicola feengrottensis]